ncbi:MAG: hypothetical protein SNJ73_01960, partial [Acetobacteraceae bacterium]
PGSGLAAQLVAEALGEAEPLAAARREPPVHPVHRANVARDRRRARGTALGTQGRATLRTIRGGRQAGLELPE